MSNIAGLRDGGKQSTRCAELQENMAHRTCAATFSESSCKALLYLQMRGRVVTQVKRRIKQSEIQSHQADSRR